MSIVQCAGLFQIYGTQGQEVTALRGVDLTVEEGDMLALLGPSGAGKTTLLWLFAGMLRPTAGVVEVCGRKLSDLNTRTAAQMRLRDVGIVMQNPGRNLLPHENAANNVLFAQSPVRGSRRAKRRRAAELLDSVGLAGAGPRPAGRLSGGEQQRLAVAVALANRPRLLLADEPTSQLDQDSAAAVIGLMRQASQQTGTTVVAVTHDPEVGAALGRTITIRDGRVGTVGRHGMNYLVVARDGSVQIPTDLLDIMPPGSLAQAVRTNAGIELRRAMAEGG